MTFALRTFRAPCAGAFRAASPALRIHSPRSLPSHLFAQSRTLRTTSRIFSAQKQEKDDAQEKQTESKTSRPSPILTVRQAAAQAAEAAKIVAARRASESGRALSEDIYTIPNALTIARIAACPALGYFILAGDMRTATVLLAAAGFTDLLDGWLARKMGSHTVFGSIADPAADKALMTVMVATLAMKGLLPSESFIPLLPKVMGRFVELMGTGAFTEQPLTRPPFPKNAHSAASRLDSRARYRIGALRILHPLRLSSPTQDLFAVLGLQSSFCPSPADHNQQIQHLPPTLPCRRHDRLACSTCPRSDGVCAQYDRFPVHRCSYDCVERRKLYFLERGSKIPQPGWKREKVGSREASHKDVPSMYSGALSHGKVFLICNASSQETSPGA